MENSDDLKGGTFFLYEGALYLKTNMFGEAVRVFDGFKFTNFLNRKIQPVSVWVEIEQRNFWTGKN